ncbi:branched-chain amino acid ABC transporter substrate-binding protein [Undibacterium sp. FT137W]|uniref:Branched-chain amino acid ABC transporter substrate-binding protein n=1 Tax=Undibacterium fentianense TaxID=2828728 RepID=A0A941DXG1_9BURK|nr:branched-chain amino acid ABC transporter substrate-binding protein [Undibacterium fentianense]
MRIAVIDPLSGPFAPVGLNTLNTFKFLAQRANAENWAGHHQIVFDAFDNKAAVQESLSLLKTIADKGYRFVTQGTGSAVGLALIDAINKHNQRNPGKEIIFLNHGSIDPEMTNSKCSFWHFRFDANSDMKMEVLTSFLANDKTVKHVYLFGQNYSHGQQVSRAAKAYLARKRPDIKIVGDDLHPIGNVKDFSPYISKIKASGADTVITGNWGADLSLLIKSAREHKLDANFYTYYASSSGVPTAMGDAGLNKVKLVGYWHPNNPSKIGSALATAYKEQYKDDFSSSSTYVMLASLSKAIKLIAPAQTDSIDPVRIAFTLENMTIDFFGSPATIRRADHQIQLSLYISNWAKVNGKDVQFDQEDTGLGWQTLQRFTSEAANQTNTCQMQRPN